MRILLAMLFTALASNMALGAEAPLTVLLDRAKTFESVGLPAVAREQYKLALRLYPKAPGVEKSLIELSRREAQTHLDNARRAHDQGVLPLAIRELDQALLNTPGDREMKALHGEWEKEEHLRAGLRERVSKDYLQGVALYQKGQTDRAVGKFLKVLNLDPHHKGAMGYVERIGQTMDTGAHP